MVVVASPTSDQPTLILIIDLRVLIIERDWMGLFSGPMIVVMVTGAAQAVLPSPAPRLAGTPATLDITLRGEYLIPTHERITCSHQMIGMNVAHQI